MKDLFYDRSTCLYRYLFTEHEVDALSYSCAVRLSRCCLNYIWPGSCVFGVSDFWQSLSCRYLHSIFRASFSALRAGIFPANASSLFDMACLSLQSCRLLCDCQCTRDKSLAVFAFNSLFSFTRVSTHTL